MYPRLSALRLTTIAFAVPILTATQTTAQPVTTAHAVYLDFEAEILEHGYQDFWSHLDWAGLPPGTKVQYRFLIDYSKDFATETTRISSDGSPVELFSTTSTFFTSFIRGTGFYKSGDCLQKGLEQTSILHDMVTPISGTFLKAEAPGLRLRITTGGLQGVITEYPTVKDLEVGSMWTVKESEMQSIFGPRVR